MAPSEPSARDFWGKRGASLAWIATLLLCLPALRAGFSLDDFLQRLVLEGKAPELGMRPSTLYDFTGEGHSAAQWLERGYLPWHATPEFSLRFFRPLGSLSIALDHALFGPSALSAHLSSAALFLAITALAFALFRTLLTPRRAGLAAFLFAVASGHQINLTWVAGRHVLVGGLFGAFAVLAHVRAARRARWLPGWLAAPSLLLAALASETGLAAAALIASYELFAREAPAGARLRKAAPWIAAGAVYVALYAAAGYGVKHSELYISPTSAPLAYLGAAATRLPILLGELALSLPSFLWGAAEPARPALALLGAAGAALVVMLARRASSSDSERRQVTWLAAAALLGTLPMVGGVPDGRVLLVPMLVSFPLVATAIDGALTAEPRRLWLRACAGLLSFQHLGFATLARIGTTELVVNLAQKQRELASTADFGRCEPGSDLFVVTGADPSLCLSGGTSLRYFRPDLSARHPNFTVLSLAPHALRLERPSSNRLLLEIEGEPRRTTIFERLFRDSPLVVGEHAVLQRFAARVLATEDGLFTRVAFDLPDNACLVTLEQQRLIGNPLPPVGGARRVSHEKGPLGL